MSVSINEEALENMRMLLGEQFEDTLEFCLSEFERLEQEVLMSLNGNDIEAATRHAHSLKSNAAQFGAVTLSNVARAIEAALVEQKVDIAKLNAEDLSQAVASSKAQLQQWLTAHS